MASSMRTAVSEVTQNLRAKEQTAKIIFMDVEYVVYCTSLNDRQHQQRSRNDVDTIHSHPTLTEKISEQDLKTLDKYDLSCVLGFDVQAVQHLISVCESQGARIVLGSQWGHVNTLEKQKALYAVPGFSQYIVDNVKDIDSLTIAAWLIKNSASVNSFVVLHGRNPRFVSDLGSRVVSCSNLFSEQNLQQAIQQLNTPIDFTQSIEKMELDSIERNSSQRTEFVLDAAKILNSQIGFGWDTNTFLTKLFLALEQNNHLTKLSFHGVEKNALALDGNNVKIDLLKRINQLLQIGKMHLEKLDLAENNLTNINELIEILDGKNCHIPYLCFSHNYLNVEGQAAIANWLVHYPKPLTIEIHSNSNYLTTHLLSAVVANSNIRLVTAEHSFDKSKPELKLMPPSFSDFENTRSNKLFLYRNHVFPLSYCVDGQWRAVQGGSENPLTDAHVEILSNLFNNPNLLEQNLMSGRFGLNEEQVKACEALIKLVSSRRHIKGITPQVQNEIPAGRLVLLPERQQENQCILM